MGPSRADAPIQDEDGGGNNQAGNDGTGRGGWTDLDNDIKYSVLIKKLRAAPEMLPSSSLATVGVQAQPIRNSPSQYAVGGLKRQDKMSTKSVIVLAVETTISKPRLARFSMKGLYNSEQSLEIYLWNCRLSAEFLMPLHFAEISIRNAIQKALHNRLSDVWYNDQTFLKLLDTKQRSHLILILEQEKDRRHHSMSDDYLISDLDFGFWDHLTTKRFARLLWSKGIKHNFPNAYKRNLRLGDVSALIQTVRQWRNRIAHHRAIFDKDPAKKFEQTISLIHYVCADTAAMVRSQSGLLDVLANPPFEGVRTQ